MGRLFFTLILFLGFKTCFGQFENGIPGMYITADIGIWHRVLVLKPDSTYFFCVDTDLGGQDYIEPIAVKLPSWTIKEGTSEIILNPIDKFDPKLKMLSWDTVSLRSGSKKELRIWDKIADMDSLGNVLTFKDGKDLIKFSSGYQPLYSERYNPKERRTTRITYQKLTDQEMVTFRERYLKHTSFKGDLYSQVRFIKSMIEAFYPIVSTEEISYNGKTNME